MHFGIETQRYGQRFEITVQFVVTSAQLSFKLKKKIAYICAIFFLRRSSSALLFLLTATLNHFFLFAKYSCPDEYKIPLIFKK